MNNANAMDITLDWDIFDETDSCESRPVGGIPDALILSLTNRGRVDIEYITEITGEDYKSVIKALKGSIYQNPDKWNTDPYQGWETSEEYLSGNLRRKLKSAIEANREYCNRFEDNVIALTSLLPKSVDGKDIYITLGSPWVPADIIEDFIVHMLKIGNRRGLSVSHDTASGTWDIKNKGSFAFLYSVSAKTTYGTQRMDALEILEKTLNMRNIAVYDEDRSYFRLTNKVKRVLNRQETMLAIDKQRKMISEFQRWVWEDEERRERLESIFDERYGSIRKRVFNGSFLDFPGLDKEIELHPYQKNAVARILFSPNTLLAHDVGSGKTYIMVAAGMELRRMGLSKKNLYVVPNNIVSQWEGMFKQLYPDSRLLCVDSKSFTPTKRSATLEKVRDGDYDAVIMAYSCFDRIPFSRKLLEYKLKNATDELDECRHSRKDYSRRLRKIESLQKKIDDLKAELLRAEGSLCFDELGITRLFVDEAHNYKNLPIETGTERVLGISPTGSKKCKDMLDKVRHVQSGNNGGVVFATGTPITNSLTDIFVMQKYLQNGELSLLDINSFDAWIGMFAEKVTEFEIDVDTSSYRMATRFSKFHNLPELTVILASIADFHRADETAGIPGFDGYTDIIVPKTRRFEKYLSDISRRADHVRKGRVSVKEDNMLKITTDGRKAALDIRLVDDGAQFTHNSKVARCAEKVFDIYMRTSKCKSTQLVFCDTSTPKAEFNIYDELKRILISMGVREDEIAFIHDATDAEREKLFARVRNGGVRVLIGSTFKLGMGVNVQDRLIAIHHLDVPWRPSDMIQREGRILRQGNTNDEVFIYRYITEGSFDAYSWQLLETKQRIISEILAGSLLDRDGSDVDDAVLSYAEVKALAIGNPLVKVRVETANELSRTVAIYRKAIESHGLLEREMLEIPERIKHQRELVEKCREDFGYYCLLDKSSDKEERREQRQALAEAIESYSDNLTEDVCVMNYRGFDVVLPKGMTSEKPYLWLMRRGKYYVELGDSAAGALVRIDNYLEKLSEHLARMVESLEVLLTRKEALADELSKSDDFACKIGKLQEKLQDIDKQLGVA